MKAYPKLTIRSTSYRRFALGAALGFGSLLFALTVLFALALKATIATPPPPCSGTLRPGPPPKPRHQHQHQHERHGLERLITEERLPKCAGSGKRAQSWLIVFMGHSGSSAMISQLTQHPEVLVPHNPEAVDHSHLFHNTTAALEFTRNLFEEGRKQGKAAGFKIRPRHILKQPAAWAALVRKYNTRILWNFRTNVFKMAAGEYKMAHYNDTTVVEGLRRKLHQSEICKHTKCSFPINDMDNFHFQLRRFTTSDRLITTAVGYLDKNAGCVLPLPYEQYHVNPQQVMRKVFQFLELRQIYNPPTRFKATADNLCKLIENWDQVCRNFYHCIAWRPLMTDTRNNCGCTLSPGPFRYCKVDNF